MKTKIIERENNQIAVKAQYISHKIENKVAKIENVYSFHDNNPKQVKNKIGEHLGFIKLPLDR